MLYKFERVIPFLEVSKIIITPITLKFQNIQQNLKHLTPMENLNILNIQKVINMLKMLKYWNT